MAEELRVLIATARRTDLLQRTLKSLSECLRPAIYRETIVASNGPPCGAEEIVKQTDPALKARLVYCPRPNKSEALNQALREFPDECLVVFFDDDVRLSPGVLVAYADAAAELSEGVFFGGPTSADYDPPPPDWLKKYLPASAAGWHPDRNSKALWVGTYIGFNWAGFVGDIRRAGYLDPRLAPGTPIGGGEDSDMHLRLLKAGVRSQFVSDALVWHFVPPERCSKKFALERRQHQGLFDGHRRPLESGIRWSGVPRWRYRVCFSMWLQSWILRLTGTEEEHFISCFDLAYYRGLMRGATLKYRELQTSDLDGGPQYLDAKHRAS